jgi:hypothetical protein
MSNYFKNDSTGTPLNTTDLYSVYYRDRMEVCRFLKFSNLYAQVEIVLEYRPGLAKPNRVSRFDSISAIKMSKIPEDCIDEVKGYINESNL